MSEPQNPKVGNVGQENSMVNPLNTPVNTGLNTALQPSVIPLANPTTLDAPPSGQPPAPTTTPQAPPVVPPVRKQEKAVELKASDYVCLDCAEKKGWKRKPGDFPANRCKVCGLIKNGAKVDEYEK